MKKLSFKKIDAFTKGSSQGNPAGYILMEPDELLNEEEMQKVAAELKGFVSEMGYVSRKGTAFDLRFYSSECEVAFCGHATIAIMYDLICNTPELKDQPEVLINVTAGTLSVFNRVKEEDAVYIMAPAPTFLECKPRLNEIADALEIDSAAIDERLPIRVIDGGLRTLIIPIRTLDNCLDTRPDQEKLRRFCLENEIDIVHIFVNETHSSLSKYRTRVFAPKFGYLEDPATGSGNAAFGHYLIRENAWEDDFMIEQGPCRSNPNYVKLKRLEKDGAVHILFGGCGTPRIEGRYCLQEV